MVLVITAWLAFNLDGPLTMALCAGGFILGVLGLWDDLSGLGRLFRFAVQAGVVLAVVLTLPQQSWLALPALPAAVFLAVAILWHLNLFNFMDGIDGIAATQVLIFVFGSLALATEAPAWLTGLLWVMGGAGFGFLAFNWPPARIFMGDAGSLHFGLLLAALTLVLADDGLAPVPGLILLSVFWTDASVTLVVRTLTGQNPFDSHRLHLYQKLAQRHGHRRTTAAFAAYGAFWLFPLAALAAYHSAVRWAALAAAVIPLLVMARVMKAGVPETEGR
jgi:Fuc2NAc and GlcNAc transferase